GTGRQRLTVSGRASPDPRNRKSPGSVARNQDPPASLVSTPASRSKLSAHPKQLKGELPKLAAAREKEPATSKGLVTTNPRNGRGEGFGSPRERRLTLDPPKAGDEAIPAKPEPKASKVVTASEKGPTKRMKPHPYQPTVPSPLSQMPRQDASEGKGRSVMKLRPASSLGGSQDNPPAKRSRLRKESQSKPQGTYKVQVAVRVRALTRSERLKRDNVIADIPTSPNALKVILGDKKEPAAFQFDHVFGPSARQAALFDGVVAPMVAEVIKGFNCTIFAYGQTGTGKTFTIEGNLEVEGVVLGPDAGLIPRALHSLFHQLGEDPSLYSIRISMLELYNEEARDLLSSDPGAPKLMLTNDARDRLCINGLEEQLVEDTAAGIALLKRGSARRHTAVTFSNATSSRSHCIFTITVRTKGQSGDASVRVGKLHLVDLAGSEDTKVSGASNQRAREAGSINMSLLALGRVISALVACSESSSRVHIPYRESKLTRILADSLGGNSKTCIIATVAPSRRCLDETLSTLKYASKAMRITNSPIINRAISPSSLLKDLEAEVRFLRHKLLASGSDEARPASINRALREIQLARDNKQLQESKAQSLLQVESALREAYAASELGLNAIATQLLEATRESAQHTAGLRQELARRSATAELAKAKLDSLADTCEAAVTLQTRLSATPHPQTASCRAQLLPAVDQLDAEIEFHKGATYRSVIELKDGLDAMMRKLASHIDAPVEAEAQLSRGEALISELTQRRDAVLQATQGPPNDEGWQQIQSAAAGMGALCESLQLSFAETQGALRRRANDDAKLHKLLTRSCQRHLANIRKYELSDHENSEKLHTMFNAIKGCVPSEGSPKHPNLKIKALGPLLDTLSNQISELRDLLRREESTPCPQWSATPSPIRGLWSMPKLSGRSSPAWRRHQSRSRTPSPERARRRFND
ncbi:Kinesin- motor protein, partial [Massospora cicadina]